MTGSISISDVNQSEYSANCISAMIHLTSEITQEEKSASALETLYEYNSPKKIGAVQEGFLVPLIAN